MATPSAWAYATVTLIDPPPAAVEVPAIASAAAPPAVMHGPRDASWRFEVIQRDDSISREQLLVSGHSLSWDKDRAIPGGGSVVIGGTYDQPEIQQLLLGKRIRPVYSLNGIDHPLGLFKPAAAPAGYRKGLQQIRTIPIVESGSITGRTVGSFTLPVATNVAVAVRAIAGSVPVSVVNSGATLRTEMSWPDDTPWMVICDALLASAGHTPLRPGVNGVLLSAPFVPAVDRAVAHDFRNDSEGIYKPEFDIDSNWLSVPNRVRVVARSSSNAPALVGYASDENPASPWSFQSRGEWIEETVTDTVDATSQEAVNAIAAMELTTRQQAAATLSYECAWIPELTVGAVVGFHNTRHRLSGLWEVSGIDWPAGSLVRVTARSVA